MQQDIFDQVYDFNDKVLGVKDRPLQMLSAGEFDYARKAMAEELQEFVDAQSQGDIIASIDSLMDEIYFCIGFLVRMGVTKEKARAIFTAVHNANMTKKKGTKPGRSDENGSPDAIKPPEFVPPEEAIAKILDEQS